MTDHGSRPEGNWEAVESRIEELKAVLPDLADLPRITPDNLPSVLLQVAETTERLRRRVIRDRILRASLQELMQALLQSEDPEGILDTLTGYLRQVLGVDEVLLLRKSGATDGWNGHYTGPQGIPERLGSIDWTPPEGSMQMPVGIGLTTGSSDDGLTGSLKSDPKRFGYVLPLGAEGPASRGHGQGGADECMGYLCLNSRREPSDQDWSPQEIARRVGGMLMTLRHREEMERAHRFRRQLLEAMQDGVLALDAEGRILEANGGMIRMIARTEGDLRGCSIGALQESAPGLVRHLREALEKKAAPPSRELLLQTKDRRVPVSVAISELRAETGEFQGIVVNLTDLTPVREMEEEIDRLDRLAALGRFAAGVAHEIRNPLAGIGAGVEYLSRRFAPSAPEQEDVRFVTREIQRLNDIVSDLLDYSHPRPLDLQLIDAASMGERIRSTVQPRLAEKELRLETTGGEGISVWADSGRIEQVLLNLVVNAIEASPDGRTVRLSWEAGGSEGPVRFIVEDEGDGMSEEARRRAFEPFFTTKGTGTGLGLYLSHSIIDQHGGRLILGDRPGSGARVTMELPGTRQEGHADHEVVHLDR